MTDAKTPEDASPTTGPACPSCAAHRRGRRRVARQSHLGVSRRRSRSRRLHARLKTNVDADRAKPIQATLSTER